jgi:phosphoglycerate dehydrogenase-like enzyme
VNAPAEHVWALILALARHLPKEASNMRHGGWQTTVGMALRGRKLGPLGLGRVAQAMCPVAEALAWT